MLLSLISLFYFMNKTTFYCEKSNSQLILLAQKENLISLSIENPNEEVIHNYMYLTIKDAEKLMDEIHIAIIKAEGGK